MKKFINIIKKNPVESFLLLLVIILALGVRLFRIVDYMTFLGDEGRDVRIVRDLITKGDLVFIGPMTSVGNMYLGPLYYYMMAPALFLSRLNPVGPAMMNAILGTLTIFLTWFVGRQWFGKWVGLIAALLFALSPVAIIYSRSSWNPNPMPLFALLCIWGIYEVWRNKKYFWLPIIGVSFAFALQMHYLGLLLAPTLGLFWLLSYLRLNKSAEEKRVLIKHTLFAVIAFLVLMSPLLLFDLKHNGMNFNAFKTFFSNRETTVNLNPTRSDRFLPAIESIVSELLLGRQLKYALWGAIVIGIFSFMAYFGKARATWKDFFGKKKDVALSVIFTWIGFGILGLGIYKQHIYAHYFGFLFPAVYLLAAYLLVYLWKRNVILKILSVIFFACLIYHAVVYSPLRETPNRQLWRTEAAVDLIIKESRGEPFNFGLLAKQNYDESYRYFLENKKANMFRGEDKVTDQLFVICEDGDKCAPEGDPAFQIAIFGASEAVQEWQIDHLRIFLLVHYK